jgi:predicted dehydrogenase
MNDGEDAALGGRNESMTRVGVLGAGFIANRHVGNLIGFDGVRVVAVADPVLARARETAARAGATAYADARELLACEEVDALYICVPPFAHGEPKRLALEHDLPFFVEKPLATDLQTAETIACEVERRGLITAVGYHWRYLDTTEEAQRLLHGRPARLVSGYWLDAVPPVPWWVQESLSGGQMLEQTTHIFDLARLLVGEVVEVFAMSQQWERPDLAACDVATASVAVVRFAAGAVGSIVSTCELRWPHRIGLHVFADGLAIELSEFELMVDVGHGRPVRRAEGDPFVREDRDFIDAVRGAGPNRIRVPYGEALRTHRVAFAAACSARSGTPITLRGDEQRARSGHR